MVGKNHLYAQQGRNANEYANKARELFKADTDLQQQFDTELSHGKWKHFMDQPHIGYTHWNNPPANAMPLLYDRQPSPAADMGVAVEGPSTAWPVPGSYALACFDRHGKQSRHIEVFNKGAESLIFPAKTSDPWIVPDYTSMQVNTSQTIRVSIDWTKAPKGLAKGKISISGTGWGGATMKRERIEQ